MISLHWTTVAIYWLSGAYGWYCLSRDIHRRYSNRAARAFRRDVYVGAVLRDGYGRTCQVQEVGANGMIIQPIIEGDAPAIYHMIGIPSTTVSYKDAADYFVIVPSAASASVEQAMRQKR